MQAEPTGLAGRRRALRAAAALALAALVAGCGFELRRPPTFQFQRIALKGFPARSPLADELGRSLSTVATLEEAPDQAQVVVECLLDQREMTVLATTAAGQVRDLQLRVHFRFHVTTPGGRELLPVDELLLSRDLSYNETNALAKEQEQAQLYRAMQSDIVSQVMRRLSAVKP